MKVLLAVINNPGDSKDFIKYTYQMANDLNYIPHLLYIQNPEIYSMSSGAIHPGAQPIGIGVESDKKNALKLIQEKIKKVRKEFPNNIPINFSAEMGARYMVINQFISENNAEMFVLENQSQGGLWTSDSANMDVIQKVKCPGWMIPNGAVYKPYKKIVYPTNYNEADIQSLRRLIALTEKFSPEITALHLTDSADFKEKTTQEGFRDMIEKETNYNKISTEVIHARDNKDTGEQINEFAAEKGADLIALLKENRKFIEKIFKPSTTKKVIKRTKLPVLIFHEAV